MSEESYTNAIRKLKDLLSIANANNSGQGDIFRGDEFQIQYTQPDLALKSILLIKLGLYFSTPYTQCTMSLAYGTYDILAEKPNTSSGPAFVASGRGLEKTNRSELSLKLLSQSQQEHSDLALLTQYVSHQLNRLTKAQAKLLYLYIENDFVEHSKLAEITGTSRQNISSRLKNIGAHLIKEYINNVNQKLLLT